MLKWSCGGIHAQIGGVKSLFISGTPATTLDSEADLSRFAITYLAGMSPYISLKIKKRHYEHHMIEAHKYLITWNSDDIFF
jgi:hypothetical protein